MRVIQGSLALLLATSVAATAQQPGGRGRRGESLTNARQAIEQLIRRQVRPTDDQMTKLRQIDQRFTPRRIQLEREERQVRAELRQAMLDSANVDDARISQLVDRMVGFPGRQAAILEEENKALADVLSPLQRAKYHAIQEGIRRRIEQGRGGPPPRKPPV